MRMNMSPVQGAAAAAALAAKEAELNDQPITAKRFRRCDVTHLAALAVAPEQPQEIFDVNGALHTNSKQ